LEVKSRGPLADTRIVECVAPGCPLAVRLALAFAGRVACDLGAQVTVVQNTPDPLETIPPLVAGRSALSQFLLAGKRLEKINSTTPISTSTQMPTAAASPTIAAAALAQLCSGADAILSDRTTHEQIGAQLQTIWSIASLRGGPDDGTAQSEFTLMAAGGLLDMVGEPDRSPLRLGGHQLAYSAGLALYAGLVTALCAREAGGIPDIVRVNLTDVAVWLNWKIVTLASWTDTPVSRRGSESEWRTIRCSDGWVALVYLEADWTVLREVIDDPRLREPRFSERVERRKNAGYINSIIEQAFAHLTRAQIRDLALEKRLPLGPVWSPAELASDPQNVAREFLRQVSAQSGETLLLPRLPLLWNGKAVGAA
jgi:crotonobetainyl-CoA:carnitine CoA-transferase CaiB-like acyl-CoA transferase